MGIFEHFPYSNFHDLNLDRILERTQAAEEAVQAAEAAAEAAAASVAQIANFPASAYKELTVYRNFISYNTDYVTSSMGRTIGLVLAGGSLLLALDGLMLNSSLTFNANTEYKLLDIKPAAAEFLPDMFYAPIGAVFQDGTPVQITASYNQSNHADGIYMKPSASITTTGQIRAIYMAPAPIPFFSDLA